MTQAAITSTYTQVYFALGLWKTGSPYLASGTSSRYRSRIAGERGRRLSQKDGVGQSARHGLQSPITKVPGTSTPRVDPPPLLPRGPSDDSELRLKNKAAKAGQFPPTKNRCACRTASHPPPLGVSRWPPVSSLCLVSSRPAPALWSQQQPQSPPRE